MREQRAGQSGPDGQGEPKGKGLEEFVGEQEDYEGNARVLD